MSSILSTLEQHDSDGPFLYKLVREAPAWVSGISKSCFLNGMSGPSGVVAGLVSSPVPRQITVLDQPNRNCGILEGQDEHLGQRRRISRNNTTLISGTINWMMITG
jgi:hypothetical protein